MLYARNYPTYQNILFQHVCDKILMPSQLGSIIYNFVSGSMASTQGKCQHSNAMVEELNKESKFWLKMSGVPSSDH